MVSVDGILRGEEHPPTANAVVYKTEDKVIAKKYSEKRDRWIRIARGEAGVDDAEVIQKALDSLTTGKILIKRGTYLLNNYILLQKSNVTIEGEGFNTVLKQSDNANLPLILGQQHEFTTVVDIMNIIIRNLVIDYNKANNTHESDGNGIVLENVCKFVVQNVLVKDVYRIGILVRGASEGGTIKANIVTDCGDGIWVTCSGVKNIEIEGNIISGYERYGIAVEDYAEKVVISGNLVKSIKTEGPIGIALTPGNKNVVTGNIVLYGEKGIFVAGQGNIVSNNIVIEPLYTGIKIQDALGICVEDNLIYNAGEGGTEPFGILGINSPQMSIQSNIIVDDQETKTMTHGIFIDACSYSKLLGNLSIVKEIGFRIKDSNECIIVANKAKTDAGGTGIYEEGTSNYNIIALNNVRENPYRGITFSGAYTLVKHNIGYTTENSGTAKVTGNGTDTTFTVDITHGLVKDKLVAKITLDREGTVDKVYLVDKDGDGFKETLRVVVTFATAPADGEEVPIYWYAEVV